MSDSEQEEYEDASEVELVDLDAHQLRHNNVDIPLPAAPARLSLRKQLSRRQKVLRLTITAGVLVLALSILLGSTVSGGLAPIRDAAIGLFRGTTPTPTPGANAEYFYFDASPSWGKLSVDGQTIARPPIIQRDEPLYLSLGSHQLVWTAEPFAPQTCLLTVPIPSGYASGACSVEPAFKDEFGPTYPKVKSDSWQIFFYQSLKALTPARRAALIQAAQATLDAQQSTETIYPGEHYLFGGNTVTTARQPLRATLHFQLDTPDEANPPCVQDEGPCSFTVQGQTQNCLWFCTQPSQFEYITEGWDALVMIHALWDYTTPDGQVVAYNQPDITNDASSEYSHMSLQITWDGRNWHVRQSPQEVYYHNNPICASAFEATNAYPSFIDTVRSNTPAGIGMSATSGPVYAQGCLLMVQIQPANPTTPPPSPFTTAYCLYRFGVLLAANDLAHHYWPSMLLADKYERGLTQQWVGDSQG